MMARFCRHFPSLLLLPILLTACSSASRPPEHESSPPPALPANFDVEGHRGARGLKPENTLPAFETALDLGVTTLELDLHFSQDGTVVVWHDPLIASEKCGLRPGAGAIAPDPDGLIKAGAALMVSQLTWEQLGAFRCDRNPEPDRFPQQNNQPTPLAGDNYGLVSLGQLFDFVAAYSRSPDKSEAQRANAAQVQFNIETKRQPDSPKTIGDNFDGVQPGPFELAILEVVAAHGLQDRVIIQSFDHRSLRAIRRVNADIRLAALTRRQDVPAFSDFTTHQFNIWSPDYRALTTERVANAHELGLLVIPWTVNDREEMQQLIDMGVDGLISDRPDLLLVAP